MICSLVGISTYKKNDIDMHIYHFICKSNKETVQGSLVASAFETKWFSLSDVELGEEFDIVWKDFLKGYVYSYKRLKGESENA